MEGLYNRVALGGADRPLPFWAADVAAKAQIARLGPVSVLMCNAGREGGGGILAEENVWRRTLETNLWGAIHCLQLTYTGFTRRRGITSKPDGRLDAWSKWSAC